MCNLLIKTEDSAFRFGITNLMHQIFYDLKKEGVLTIVELAQGAIACADIIVMEFIAGESVVCHQTLQTRKNNSIIFGFYEGNKTPYSLELPLCLSNTVFISKSASINTVREAIIKTWMVSPDSYKTYPSRNCFDCKHRALSPQQINFANLFDRSEKMDEIARFLNINTKTAHAHKLIIKKKYNIDTDLELLNLLRIIKVKDCASELCFCR
ncbi:hypothetical protein OH773_10240 [Buttiauxella sp. WJP83]|uniref:helix-turn-helix transcriptional regulator n=1 Tax=Buttiauxella sp. WJP83 TaxID=2986951 RepID=UPI0022DE6E5F|nr:hypothetical protein [Buttiauxella sp. WJP83]WBM72581.1 hypothetical protein OH773_10240 [Buttiauxella sp. WJP83]